MEPDRIHGRSIRTAPALDVEVTGVVQGASRACIMEQLP